MAHRDLKLENILIDDKMNIKVADFGFATSTTKRDRLKAYGGTRSYMAPEVIAKKYYNGQKIDIFAVGVIMFIVVNGCFPFKSADPEDDYYKLLISETKQKAYWKAVRASRVSDDFKNLLTSMMNMDPDKRPSLQELENHKWMKQQIPTEKIRSKLISEMNWEAC